MKYTSLLPLAALLLTGACKKEPSEEEKLPAATQQGKGTAGCLVDSKAWTPEFKGGFLSAGSPYFVTWRRTPHGKRLAMSLRKVNSQENTGVYFFLPDIRRAGSFALDQPADPLLTSSNPPYGLFANDKPFPSREYFTGPDATGTLVVTRFDTVARVVSGTFELSVREPGSGQTHELTRGRFDVKF